MGLFSFLSSRKDDDAVAVRDEQTTPSVDNAPASVQPEADDKRPQPAAESVAPATPFTPPEAWGMDVDALTRPSETPPADPPQVGPLDPVQTAELQPKIVEAIKTVFDPEIPVDIYELGLIYDVIVDAERRVLIRMTLTSPACPSAQQIPSEVRYKVKAIPGVTDAWVDIVWDPPWSKELMSEAAKLSLGFF
jgi:FeS assembly SUF system protein